MAEEMDIYERHRILRAEAEASMRKVVKIVCIGIVGMNSRGVLGKTLGSELLYLHTDG
jgi:hypothetical protein